MVGPTSDLVNRMPQMPGFQAGSDCVIFLVRCAKCLQMLSINANLTLDSGGCTRESMANLKFDSFTSSAKGGKDLCVFRTVLELSLAGHWQKPESKE